MRSYLILFLLLITTGTYAQQFRSGLVLGLNGAQITGDDMEGFNKVGPYAGVFSEYFFDQYHSLDINIVFTQKGSRRTRDKEGNPGPGDWDLMRLNYMEVPILYRYNPQKLLSKYDIEYDKISVFGGLGFAWLISEYSRDVNVFDVPDLNFANNFELSMLFGADYKISNKLIAFINYQYSVYDMSVGETTPFWKFWGNTSRGYINVVSTLGIRFYFKGIND